MARKPITDLSAWPSLSLEGNLIAPAMVARIAEPKDDAATREGYGIRKGLTIREEISTAFRVGQSHVDAFMQLANPSVAATTRFIGDFLKETFGFGDLVAGDGVVSLLSGGRVPVVVVPPTEDRLDRRSQTLSTDRNRSPAFALQDVLNEQDDTLWGLVTNGVLIRLMRDNASLTRPAYIEANLTQIFANEDAASFTVLWLLIHRSRFGITGAAAADCALERWREAGAREGEAARDRLAGQVRQALKLLGSGFLEANPELTSRLQSGEINLTDWFNELLRLVYRLIFLMVAEDRNLLHPEHAQPEARQLYAQGYSLSYLRTQCFRATTWDKHVDRYEGIKVVFRALAQAEPRLGLPALGGLFAEDQLPHVVTARLRNRAFMEALYRLSWLAEKASMVPVNWRAMETEELGSVYETLLELQPQLGDDGKTLIFDAEAAEQRGNQRKTTSSFYTPDSLVQALLDTALNPVLDRVEAEADDPIRALIALKLLDPACGSGHFLLAAARRIATRLARLRAGGTPSLADFRHALRDVARCCIHGVDRNPMAVELTKVALWIETVDPGLPLGFFDAQIRCGDSLLGVFDLQVLEDGIPDAAYKPLIGDDKRVAKYYLKTNKDAKHGQGGFDFRTGQPSMPAIKPLALDFSGFRALPEETVEQIVAKARRFTAMREQTIFARARMAADLYVAAFLMPKTGAVPMAAAAHRVPTTAELWGVLNRDELPTGLRAAPEVAREALAFHWPLEFPDVMERGGFDVVFGNPPYLSAIEHANSEGPRSRLFIQEHFVSAKGAFDIYVPFIERGTKLASSGISCLLTPNKFLSAPYGEALRRYISDANILSSLDDFSRGSHFADASVYPVITALKKEAEKDRKIIIHRHINGEAVRFQVQAKLIDSLPSNNLGPLLSDGVDRLFSIIEECVPFSSIAEINASTTAAEADEYTKALLELDEASGDFWKVVNTGTIDPFKSLWGTRQLRHAKREFLMPVFPKSSLIISDRRKSQYDQPKIVFAKIGNTTEAFFDESGDYAGLNINFAFVDAEQGKFLTSYVNSAIGSWVYRQLFGALAMSGGYLQYQSPQIRDWPVPQFDPANARHVAVVRGHERLAAGECSKEALDQLVERVLGG